MLKFLFGNRQECLDVPVDKREKAHEMLDKIIDESDWYSSFEMKERLYEYIKGLKVVYKFREISEK